MADIPLDEEAIRRLEASFEAMPVLEFAQCFHRRLLAHDPSLRSWTSESLERQEGRLLAALQATIHALRSPARVQVLLEELGRTCASMSQAAERRQAVAMALVEAVAELSGAAWDPELESHWTTTARLVSEVLTQRSVSQLNAEPGSGRTPV